MTEDQLVYMRVREIYNCLRQLAEDEKVIKVTLAWEPGLFRVKVHSVKEDYDELFIGPGIPDKAEDVAAFVRSIGEQHVP